MFILLPLFAEILSEEDATQTSGYIDCLSLHTGLRSLKRLGITVTIFKQHRTFQEGCQ